jgi:uncharacterized protein (TIGR02246 family)
VQVRSPGWRTDPAFPRFDGVVEDRGAYLVVRTPSTAAVQGSEAQHPIPTLPHEPEMTRIRLILPLCLLVLAACSVSSAHEIDMRNTVPDPGEVAQIQELSRRFSAAYVAGDIETMVGLYTPDAVIFPVNSEMLQGPDAIRRFWTIPAGQRITRHLATPTEIRIDGDHAYDYGVYEVAGVGGNGAAWGPTPGKYVIVWRRTPQGWRMHLDMWNSRPQPAR